MPEPLGGRGGVNKSMHRAPMPNLPLMTGVKTAMPSKFGSVTVLSRMSPPMLLKKDRK